MPREPHPARRSEPMSTPFAMLHPELLDPDDIQAISRDGRRLDHAEAAALAVRIADNCQERARFRRQPYSTADDQRGFLRARGGGCQRDGNRRGHDARLRSPDGSAGAGRLDWAMCFWRSCKSSTTNLTTRNTGPARCSKRWWLRATRGVKPAEVSTAIDYCVKGERGWEDSSGRTVRTWLRLLALLLLTPCPPAGPRPGGEGCRIHCGSAREPPRGIRPMIGSSNKPEELRPQRPVQSRLAI